MRCNDALGQLKEDPELALRAAEYMTVGGFAPLDLIHKTHPEDDQPAP